MLSKIPSPGEAIRGPRRVRTTSVPPAPSPKIDPARLAVTAKLPRLSVSSDPDVRATPHAPFRVADIRLSSRRASAVTGIRRAMWFSAGILLGAFALSAIRGEMRGARHWTANALRSLESNPGAAATDDDSTTADLSAKNPPCTPEDCALLVAPFQQAKPKGKPRHELAAVSVEDLPRAPPAVVYLPPPAPVKPAESADTLAPTGASTAVTAASAVASITAPVSSAPVALFAAMVASASAAGPSAASSVPVPPSPAISSAPASTSSVGEPPRRQSVAENQ